MTDLLVLLDRLDRPEVESGWLGTTVPSAEHVDLAFQQWEEEHGIYAAAWRYHGWRYSPIDSVPDVQSGHACEVYRAWLGCDHLDRRAPCSCVGGALHAAVCRPCDWQTTHEDTNAVIELWHDHAWPGWRDLRPGTAPSPEWARAGAPIVTARGNFGTRHVPGRSPQGGYDLADTHRTTP